MGANIRHDIDRTDPSAHRPHVHLCHLILSEALANGFSTVEIATSDGSVAAARAQLQGNWKDFMAFPLPVYNMLVAYLKQMAALDPVQPEAEGVIHVRSRGRELSIRLGARRTTRGFDEILLRFPASTGPQAAV